MALMVQNRLKEQIEQVKTERLQVQLEIEREGLRKDQIRLSRARVQTQIERVGLQIDNTKLTQTQTQLGIEQVKLGKLNDQLGFEQVDRVLTQRSYAYQLNLKETQVNKLAEQARHEAAMLFGGGNIIPFPSRRQAAG